jgi:hypothetical protein
MSTMATGASLQGRNTPTLNRGKSSGGMTPYSMQQFTPEQMQLFKQSFTNLGPDSFLSKLAGGDQSQFEQLEAPAMRQFQELQGDTASRFSGMGLGARKGSGFKNQMNQYTSDFSQQLQSQRLGLQRQAIKDLFSMSNTLMGQRPYDDFLVDKEKKKKGWGGAIGAGIGGFGGFFAGGPAGALAGAQLGYGVGSKF